MCFERPHVYSDQCYIMDIKTYLFNYFYWFNIIWLVPNFLNSSAGFQILGSCIEFLLILLIKENVCQKRVRPLIYMCKLKNKKTIEYFY